jgi:hypothetical protein
MPRRELMRASHYRSIRFRQNKKWDRTTGAAFSGRSTGAEDLLGVKALRRCTRLLGETHRTRYSSQRDEFHHLTTVSSHRTSPAFSPPSSGLVLSGFERVSIHYKRGLMRDHQ